MTDYTPPNNNSLFFNFSSTGYRKPNFDDISFNFTALVTEDLQATINVAQLYHDTTYTFTKSCRKIIVGYTNNGVQVIELPCLFGGIRDLATSVVPILAFTAGQYDLYAYIPVFKTSFSTFATNISVLIGSSIDILAYSRALQKGSDTLITALKPLRQSSTSFSSFVRRALRSNVDLLSYSKFMQGHAIASDLSAILTDIQPVDISSFLNIIEIRNLYLNIEGTYFKGHVDLYTDFDKVLFRSTKNILSNIHGWATQDLRSSIRAFWTKDLNADLFAGYFKINKNLTSLIYCIAPKNLGATLHGYDLLNLSIFTIIGFTPNDLQATIAVIKHENLLGHITGKLGLGTSFNLPANIKSNHVSYLYSYINLIESKNLLAYIDAVGKYLDLTAKIAPKTINIKRMLFIPLLEHSDLKATIQYSCKSSGYRDFSTYIYPIRIKDLKSYIIGWYGSTTDNIIDLKAYINYASYVSQGYIEIQGFSKDITCNTLDIIVLKPKSTYENYNTFMVYSSNNHLSLLGTIVGNPHAADLACTLRAKPIANFTALPSWMNPTTLEAVINLTRFEERWTRFVEMMFFTNSSEDFHYFYVSGENKIYKVDKKRTWKIYVTGYATDSDSIYTRTNVVRKFVFNLNSYKSVDEAVRDLIDRVTLFRSLNLTATITAYDYDHTNLVAKLQVSRTRSWVKGMKANIKGTTRNYLNFVANIQPKLFKSTNNLTVNIIGKAYEAPLATNITFKFTEANYVPAPYYNNMNWTYKQAEVFWKED